MNGKSRYRLKKKTQDVSFVEMFDQQYSLNAGLCKPKIYINGA